MKDGFNIQDKVTIKKIKKNSDKKINIFSINDDELKNEKEDRTLNEDNR